MATAHKTLAGRYRLTRPVGTGGMGRVWEAEDLRLQRTVAVKILSSHHAESDHAWARFEREALSAGRLKSPHIVRVHDAGVDDGTPFIVMELIEGTDLQRRLGVRGSLDVEETAIILHHTARALRVAHKAGMVHRDLKPGNLMIDQSDAEEVIKVMDFGVAKEKRIDDDLDSSGGPKTAPDMMLGTPQYMSPEQARDTSGVDARSDVWSLGVIAYRCLTGRLPFSGNSVASVLVSVCTDEPLMASELRPGLPPQIDRFFERALAKDPNERFQTATQLVEAYFQICELSEPVDRSLPGRSGPLSSSGEWWAAPISSPTLPSSNQPPPSQPAPTVTSPSLIATMATPVAPPPRSTRRIVMLALLGLVVLGGSVLAWRTVSSGAAAAPVAQTTLAPVPVESAATAPSTSSIPAPAAPASGSASATPSASASSPRVLPWRAPPKPKEKADPESELYGERN